MKLVNFGEKNISDETTLILGSFESIHLGHISLIEKAKTFKNKIAILLISNPKDLPNKKNHLYSQLEIRLQQLANLYIDFCIILNFNDEIKKLKGETFLNAIVKQSNAKNIIIGKDFAMGQNRDLNSKAMVALFENTFVMEELKFNDKKISTSLLKELVQVGDMDVIKKLSPFSYTTKVNVNYQNYNFKIEKTIMPQKGIYASWSIVNDIKYWSIIKIGFENCHIVIPDLINLKNDFEVIIEFQKIVRYIFKKEDDFLYLDEDKEKVMKFLKKNI